MKTQLLEDIEDSGALPLRARPAVWHRPRGNVVEGPRGATAPPEPAAAGHGARIHGVQDKAGSPAFVPDPAAPATAAPDWLADILRQDAERAAGAHWPPPWAPRLVGWGGAACLLALLAAAGLWLADAQRVDGALVVVAETTPAPAQTPALPQGASTLAAVPAPVPAQAAPIPAGPEIAVIEAPSGPRAGKPVPAVPVRTAASKPSALQVGAARRRREETLMQCQALGYDERQCLRRGCALTRYGLACPG